MVAAVPRSCNQASKACCLAALVAAMLFAAWHGLALRTQTPWTRVLPALAQRATPGSPGLSTPPTLASAATTQPAATSAPAAIGESFVAESDDWGPAPPLAEQPAAVETAADPGLAAPPGLPAAAGDSAAARATAVPPDQDRLFGRPLSRVPLGGNEQPFEPAAYRRYSPDVGNLTDDALAAHYLGAGRKGHHVAQRLRVVMSYQAAGLEPKLYGGLCNQIYVHVGMLAVAAQMGAEVVLPDAVHRGGRGFQADFFAGETVTVAAPLDTLVDVEHLVSWGGAVGVVFHGSQPSLDGAIHVNVTGRSICCGKPMEAITNTIRRAVLTAAQRYLAALPSSDAAASLPPVALHIALPQLMFALATNTSGVDLVEEVSRNLRPAPPIRRAADAIVGSLTAGGAAFNAIHLRVEQDAGFKNLVGGEEAFMEFYAAMMEAGHYAAPTPLYVASGLLTYLNASEFAAQYASRFVSRGLCGDIVVKEDLMDQQQRQGFMSESLAMVDLLVLVHAQRYTGFVFSSFSWIIQEYRCLRGLPPRTTSMVAVERPALLARFTASGWLSDHARTCPENPASAAAPAARVE